MMFFPRLFLRCEFEIVEIGDEVVAVGVSSGENNYNGVVKLNNDSARFMFEKLQKSITLPELIQACMDEYSDSSVEEVGPKVIDFLNKLKEQGLLIADPKHGVHIAK